MSLNPENTAIPSDAHVIDDISNHQPPAKPAEQLPIAPLGNAITPRKHPQTVDEPKNVSFTARATIKESERIKRAIAANGKADIVRLMLYALDLFENDILTPFKTS